MNNPVLIRDVVTLKAFEPAIKLQAISADLRNAYFKDYILTQDLANTYSKILSSIVGEGWAGTASSLMAERRRSHLIRAQYGAGKSYFLTILSALLDAAGNAARLVIARDKFQPFREMHGLLGRLEEQKFLIIRVSAEDKGDIRFKELLVSSLLREVAKVVPDAAFSNEYTAAIHHLEELESSAVGALLDHVLEQQFTTSSQQLRSRLGRYDRDALRIYYQACERTLGRPVSRSVLDVETTFQEALDLLKAHGYTYVAVLVDELTAYLNASVGHHSLSETLGELQAFAAHCNRPASRCLFVGAIHIAMEDFLQEWSQQRDYEKMKGRFDEHPLPLYSNKLLAGVFQVDETAFDHATRTHRGELNQLASLTTSMGIKDDDRPMKPSAFFPLHPAVVKYLPLISRELGQAERTSFGFINDVVRPKLDEPLVRDDQLNLVNLDQVFDYFLPAMEHKPYYQQIITAYNTVRANISNLAALVAFKPLALLWVASRVRTEEAQTLGFDLTVQQVAEFAGLDDEVIVAQALDALCQTRYIYLDPSTSKYFYSHADSGWDLESEIQREMASINVDEVLRNELQALGPRVCLRVPTNITVKVERKLESQWVDIRQLQEATSFKPKRAEAKVVFVVPELADVERYHVVFSDVTQKARSLSASNVVVAIPKQVDVLNPTELKRYYALQVIGRRLEVADQANVSEHRVRVTRARFSEVQQRLERDLEAFGRASNFIFYVNRQPQEAEDRDTILADMFERYYYRFPKVKVQSINGRSTTNALIENCIVNSRKTFSSDNSEVARQARDTLQVLGLCTWEAGGGGKYKVELKAPEEGSEGFEVWKIVLDTLTDGSRTPFETLYKRLADAPYGLPSYVVELYIAAARKLDKIYVLDRNGKMPDVGKTIVADITRQKDKGYRILPVEKTEVPYTYICSVWQAIDEPLGLRYYQELEKNLGRAVDDQKIWFALKQDSNNLLQNQLAQVQDNLGSIGVESQPLATLTKHLQQVRRIMIPAQGFKELSDLGEALSGEKVGKDPDAVALAVHQAIASTKQLRDNWRTLQINYAQYRRLQAVTNWARFGASAQTVDYAWQEYANDALSAEKRQTFVARAQELWQEYADSYVREHNAVAKARASYGQDIEKSLAFSLVSEFSFFGFRGIATRASFEAKIQQVRQQGCRPLNRDTVRDYHQFEKAVCSSCGYRLGDLTEIGPQLEESEVSLAASIYNALSSYMDKLGELLSSETIQLYAQERGSSEEKSIIASLIDLTSRPEGLDETDSRKLKALLPQMLQTASVAQEYVREQARKRKELERQLEEEERRKRIPRVSTAQLGESFRLYLLDSGLESMTLEELREWLETWLERTAEEFTPKV